MVAFVSLKPELIFRAVENMYTAVACEPAREFHFPTGRAACLAVGYPEEELRGLPAAALESFAGVGYPHRADALRAGDIVLDIGSGSGTDTLIASRRVEPNGKVYALDMTPAMRAKLAGITRDGGVTNVEILAGNAEAIPLADDSVDVVSSNGVLNLVPDKPRAFAEIFRVLRPGGRVQIADIALRKPIADKYRRDPGMWAECVVGAVPEEKYMDMLRDTGLRGVTAVDHLDYFSLSRSDDTRAVANLFGARAIVLRAHKPATARAEKPPARTWKTLATETTALAGATAAIAICSGVPALVSALAAVGAGALAEHAYMFPVFVACLGASLWLLHGNTRAHGYSAPFWAALAFGLGAVAAFWLSATGFVPALRWIYAAVAGVIASSVWSFFAARSAAPDCLAEMRREAAEHEVAPARRLARRLAWMLAAVVVLYGLYKSVEIYAPID